MSNLYRIRACRLADLRVMAREMREADRSEIVDLGMVPRHALFGCWRNSPVSLVGEVEIDGAWRCAAAWGDEGALLDPVGKAWLFTTPAVEKVPLAYFREARRHIADRLRFRRCLMSFIKADYAKALRFFWLLGFDVGEPVPLPPRGIEYRAIMIGTP